MAYDECSFKFFELGGRGLLIEVINSKYMTRVKGDWGTETLRDW